ncbi:transglycosylase domain-containing protein [Phycicoccus jejuensis]|uniref:transglycosylase domain-containing protein n=1 Tax=Phycicoccus jejuensis TaxID=367299 RepID=UPI00056B9BFE|nr:transglycosylase domain-containing protein [Phycicoccus jejuensis]
MSQRQPRTRSDATRRATARSGAAGAPTTSRTRRWLRRVVWAGLGAFVLGMAGFFVAYAMTDIPQPNEMVTAEASTVYYSDGKTVLARLSDEGGNRQSVPLADISPNMQHAILAAEDRDFYQNSGISPTGIARAVWVAVKGGQATQGGSTITQQYVKNYFLTQDRTLTRKAKEILISLKIDKQQSKDEILTNYLNTIYYGRGAYGIQTASQAYFKKNAKDLTPAEAAILASVIRGPSFYDPTLGAEQKANAEKRSAYILDAMVDKKWLSPQDREAADVEKTLDGIKKYTPKQLGGTNGYIVDLVKKELVSKYKLSENDIQRGGLKITSTVERGRQNDAVKAVREERPDVEDVHEGLVSIKPGNGAIVALYGGEDFAKRPLNNATQAKMQAGSTFKIFTLIAALQEKKASIRSTFPGYSPQYFEEFADPNASNENSRRGRVKNFGNEQFGNIDLLTATGHSVNTVYAKLNIEAGAKNTMQAAEDAGVRSPLEPNVADVLGTDYVTVLDMANAYATIAAQGVRSEPYIVKEIRFPKDEQPVVKAKAKTKRVFDEDLMADVITAMQEPVNGGTARYVGQNLGRPAAGKTGTSESFRSAWFDGYVPQLATAVALYRSDDETGKELPMENLPNAGSITGGTFPTRIWTAYMKAALDQTDIEQFPQPAYINRDVLPPQPTRTTQAPRPTQSSAEPSPSETPTPTETPTPSETPTPTDQPTPTQSPGLPTVPGRPSSSPSPNASQNTG